MIKGKLVENLDDKRLKEIEISLLSRKGSKLKLLGINPKLFARKSYYNGLNMILKLNKTCPTLYATNGKMQCEHDKNRSQGDLFLIMRAYYPNITFKEFRATLFELMNDRKVDSFICGNIGKRVFFKERATLRANKNNYISCIALEDELGTTLSWRGDDTLNEWYVYDGEVHTSHLNGDVDDSDFLDIRLTESYSDFDAADFFDYIYNESRINI